MLEIVRKEEEMKKGKVIKKLVRKYSLKHGDLIDINTLKFINRKEGIEVSDLMTILGIGPSSRNYIRKNPFHKTKIKIFDEKELKEIEMSVKEEIEEFEKITEKQLERICCKYKISEMLFKKIINRKEENEYKIKKSKKCIILKSSNEESKIRKDLFIEKIKYLDFINKEWIEYSKQKYRLEDEEICILLKVKIINYKNLINGKTAKMKIDLIDEYEKREIEQRLIEKYEHKDYITKEDISDMKKEIKTTNRIIREVFCISAEAFYRIMKGENRKARIVLKNVNSKMRNLKMDLKYEYGERFYTSTELRKLCRSYKIDFDDFLKNISTNINRYPYMKQALKENKRGIYIGEEHGISKEFLENYANRIENMCRKLTNRYCYSSYLYNEKLDIAQEANLLILEKGGSIEKNFSYDIDLLFHLLASKVKYFVIGKRNERYKEILLDSFDSYAVNDDEYDIFDEKKIDSVYAVDSRIKLIHQSVMKIFQKNEDYIFYHRKNAYKIIANKLKISIERLEKVIQEIKEIYLEYGFAKQCLDGSIIDMSNLEASFPTRFMS